MAHSLSAQKRVRQNLAARARNRWRLKTMREALKEFNDLLAHGDAAKAKESYSKLTRIIDRTAAKGVIHKNQAARRKSRLTAKLNAKVGGTAAKPAAKAAKSK